MTDGKFFKDQYKYSSMIKFVMGRFHFHLQSGWTTVVIIIGKADLRRVGETERKLSLLLIVFHMYAIMPELS